MAALAEFEAAGGRGGGADRDFDHGGFAFGICRGRGIGHAAGDEVDALLDAVEPEHARAVARVLLGHGAAGFGHEEGGGGEGAVDGFEVVADRAEAAVDGRVGVVGLAAGERVGGVEDAEIEVEVLGAGEVGLEAEFAEGAAVDGGGGHEGDGEDDADGDGGHEALVAAEPAEGDAESGGQRLQGREGAARAIAPGSVRFRVGGGIASSDHAGAAPSGRALRRGLVVGY